MLSLMSKFQSRRPQTAAVLILALLIPGLKAQADDGGGTCEIVFLDKRPTAQIVAFPQKSFGIREKIEELEKTEMEELKRSTQFIQANSDRAKWRARRAERENMYRNSRIDVFEKVLRETDATQWWHVLKSLNIDTSKDSRTYVKTIEPYLGASVRVMQSENASQAEQYTTTIANIRRGLNEQSEPIRSYEGDLFREILRTNRETLKERNLVDLLSAVGGKELRGERISRAILEIDSSLLATLSKSDVSLLLKESLSQTALSRLEVNVGMQTVRTLRSSEVEANEMIRALDALKKQPSEADKEVLLDRMYSLMRERYFAPEDMVSILKTERAGLLEDGLLYIANYDKWTENGWRLGLRRIENAAKVIEARDDVKMSADEARWLMANTILEFNGARLSNQDVMFLIGNFRAHPETVSSLLASLSANRLIALKRDLPAYENWLEGLRFQGALNDARFEAALSRVRDYKPSWSQRLRSFVMNLMRL